MPFAGWPTYGTRAMAKSPAREDRTGHQVPRRDGRLDVLLHTITNQDRSIQPAVDVDLNGNVDERAASDRRLRAQLDVTLSDDLIRYGSRRNEVLIRSVCYRRNLVSRQQRDTLAADALNGKTLCTRPKGHEHKDHRSEQRQVSH